MSQLRGIETFVRTVQGGSIAAAARQLGISAAAASQNLARLEKDLGTRLLSRTTRTQALTPAGEAYFARVSTLLSDLAEAHDEVSNMQSAVQGRLKVACSATFGRHMVAPLMVDFMRRYKQVRVEMTLVDRPVDHLKEGTDVSIRYRHMLEPGLVARRIAIVPMVFCAAPSYLMQHGRPTTPRALDQHACLAYRRPQDGRLMEWAFVSNGTRFVPSFTPCTVCDDIDSLAAMALAGAGITRLGSFIANPLIQAGLLEPLFQNTSGRTKTHADPEPLEFYACYQDRRHVSPAVRAYVDFMGAELQEHVLLRPPQWQKVPVALVKAS
ncbi:MAG: LysR family transcriptional regulator [Pseudomonadota bacterium]